MNKNKRSFPDSDLWKGEGEKKGQTGVETMGGGVCSVCLRYLVEVRIDQFRWSLLLLGIWTGTFVVFYNKV